MSITKRLGEKIILQEAPSQEVPAMTMKREDYTQPPKDSAVRLIIEQGNKISETALNLCINGCVFGHRSANQKQETTVFPLNPLSGKTLFRQNW